MASTLGRMLSSMRIVGTQALKNPATSQTLQLPKATLPHPTFATTSPRLVHTTGLRWVKRPDYAQVWLENKLRPKIEPKWDRELYNHLRGPVIKKRPNRNPLGQGIPRAKGVVIKTTVRKPRKPNSGNRKCVLESLLVILHEHGHPHVWWMLPHVRSLPGLHCLLLHLGVLLG